MSEKPPVVLNVDQAEEVFHQHGRWGGSYKVLTPSMRPAGGTLGVNQTR